MKGKSIHNVAKLFDKSQDKLYNEQPYPDIFDPASPYPLFKLKPLFETGQIVNSYGDAVPWSDFKGKSVALYFADYNHLKCRNLLVRLVQAYKVLNESGNSQKVEIIFVPLDVDEETYNMHRARMPWLSLKFNDKMINTLKQHFRVMHHRELPKYNYGPRSDVPQLVVIDSEGRLLQRLDPESFGYDVANRWDVPFMKF